MKCSLSDEEIRAIYRKIESEENSENAEEKKVKEKDPYLSLVVEKNLGLVGY